MRFIKECKADAVVDLVFGMCPMHLLKPTEQIKELKDEQVLEIQTDYCVRSRRSGGRRRLHEQEAVR